MLSRVVVIIETIVLNRYLNANFQVFGFIVRLSLAQRPQRVDRSDQKALKLGCSGSMTLAPKPSVRAVLRPRDPDLVVSTPAKRRDQNPSDWYVEQVTEGAC